MTTTVTYAVDTAAAVGVPSTRVTASLVGVGDRSDVSAVVAVEAFTFTDAAGGFSLQLIPNSVYREMATYYQVEITGGPTYAIVVPPSGPVSLWDCRVDPTTLNPVPPSIPPIYLTRAELAVHNGVASLDGTGKVPAAQLPAGSGGGVNTVTAADATVVVAGTPTDPTVRVGAVAESQVTNLVADLAGKAATVHTHLATDVTDLVTVVDARVQLVVAGAPAALDTLNELATALGDDANFAATVTTALAGKVALSVVTTKGDLLAATGSGAVARLAAGSNGQTVVADSSQASGLRYVDRQIGDFPLSGDGLIAASAPLTSFRDNGNLNASGWAVRMWIPAGKAITTCWAAVVTAGTLGAGGVNGFAIYDDAGTLVQSTVDDNNLWASTGIRSKALPSPIAAQSSDRFVYLAMRVTGYSVAPAFPFCQGQNGGVLDGLFGAGRRRGLVLSGSTWAGTIDTATGTSPGGYTPFLALG